MGSKRMETYSILTFPSKCYWGLEVSFFFLVFPAVTYTFAFYIAFSNFFIILFLGKLQSAKVATL